MNYHTAVGHRCVVRLWSCLLVAAVAGCGGGDAPELAPASGTVTFKGGPLAGAQVTFVPQSGPVAMAMTDLEGKFNLRTGTLDGVVVGSCKVSIVATAGGGGDMPQSMTPEDMQAMQMAGTLEPAMKKQNQSLIPKKYGDKDSSGLTFDVKKGEENNFDITLK